MCTGTNEHASKYMCTCTHEHDAGEESDLGVAELQRVEEQREVKLLEEEFAHGHVVDKVARHLELHGRQLHALCVEHVREADACHLERTLLDQFDLVAATQLLKTCQIPRQMHTIVLMIIHGKITVTLAYREAV